MQKSMSVSVNLDVSCTVVTDADCEYVGYFNIFIMFCNVSMTHTVLLYLIVGLYSHSYGIYIKAFIVVNGKEFHQMNHHW